ncbi:unnamed protein product [Polarella glacialis]|uniref:Fe2OG dioxygenase domain-containing protein n=1 Tax=Polarella glacialis TaxID=89957 RepID=A0A813ILK7_POLGL|nr:unnamed protein product [Polarella glacialis]
MEGGFLEKAISKEAAERPKTDVAAGKKEWDERTLDTMVKVLEEILLEKNRLCKQDLERRVRTGTGVREFKGKCCGAPDEPVPGETEDAAARIIKEYTRPAALRESVGPIMEWSAEIFGNVKRKGEASGQVMDSATEVTVLRDVIKECMIRHTLKLINATNSGSHANGSHDAGLLATPQGYTAGDLNSFTGEMIQGLMEEGYGIQEDFVSDSIVNEVYNELELIDFDGKLTEVQQQRMTGHRTDRICWVNFEGLDREKQPGLMALFKKMISIPFELNKKCSLYLQASASFQLAVYAEGKGYYRKHVDGGYEDQNNGRKVSCTFYVNKDWSSESGGQLVLYKRRPNPFQIAKGAVKQDEDEVVEKLDPTGGRLVLFRSRDIPHEVLPTRRKRYAVSMWLMGPPGPGDQPDHHTPT